MGDLFEFRGVSNLNGCQQRLCNVVGFNAFVPYFAGSYRR